jgi:hypothetical protein
MVHAFPSHSPPRSPLRLPLFTRHPTRYQHGKLLSRQGAQLISLDERDLHSKSINDLVLALKGAAGSSRLRTRPQHGGAGTGADTADFVLARERHCERVHLRIPVPRRYLPILCSLNNCGPRLFQTQLSISSGPSRSTHPHEALRRTTRAVDKQRARGTQELLSQHHQPAPIQQEL